MRADEPDWLVESNEGNNVMAQALVILAPDLAASRPQPLDPFLVGAEVSIAYWVTHRGSPPAVPPWFNTVYLSTHPIFDASVRYLGSIEESEPLVPGASRRSTNIVTVPSLPGGLYYLFVSADDGLHTPDNNRSNNAAGLAVTLLAPDLAPVSMSLRPTGHTAEYEVG